MLTVNDIQTVEVEVINNETGEKFTPIYEAYGEQGFQKFVAWYSQNLKSNQMAYLYGIGYEAGERRVLNQAWVGGRD
jgi:hypothetical protein